MSVGAKYDEIRRRAAAGEQHRKLAQEYGYTESGISRIVNPRNYEAVRAMKEEQAQRREEDIKVINDAFDAGNHRIREIGRATGLSISRLVSLLNRPELSDVYAKILYIRHKRERALNARKKEIQRRVAAGESRSDLAKEYNISLSFVSQMVIPSDAKSIAKRKAERQATRDEVLARADGGESYKAIAKAVGMSYAGVNRIIYNSDKEYKYDYGQALAAKHHNRRKEYATKIQSAIDDGYTTRRSITEATGLSYQIVCKIIRNPEFSDSILHKVTREYRRTPTARRTESAN